MANALSFRSRPAMRRFAGLGLAGPFLAASLLCASAQVPPPAAPNPQMAAAQAAFEALPEAERKAIQADLIWAGAFNGAVSGSFGPLTFRGINTAKAATRGAPDGILSPAERKALAQRAAAARDAAGFRLIGDERTGVRIGIPGKLLPKRDASPNGGRWQSEDGRVTLDTSATPPGGDTLEALFERATSNAVQGRKITYKLFRPDFFVVTGETATGKFYRRLASGPAGLRGFSIGYDKALTQVVDPLVIAIAASFEPFPTGPIPAAGTAVASATPAQGPASAPQPAAPPAARPSERYGAGLVVGDRLVLTATAAIDPCKAVRVGGRGARLRVKDDASGLALLEVDGVSGAAPGLRGEALGEQAGLVLVAYGNAGGQRAAMALPGQGIKLTSGSAIYAPLQPGQVGSPAFDRQGRLAAVVTADPSDTFLVAGVAPQRAYAVADGPAIAPFLAKAGVAFPTIAPAVELSTGAVVEKAGKAVLQIVCTL